MEYRLKSKKITVNLTVKKQEKKRKEENIVAYKEIQDFFLYGEEDLFPLPFQNKEEEEEEYFEEGTPNGVPFPLENLLVQNALEEARKEEEKVRKEEEEKEKERKWRKKEFKYQQILEFLRVKYNLPEILINIKPDEWAQKKLSKESMEVLNLRSPKLTKALCAFGVPQKEVSIILGATQKENKSNKQSNTQVLDDRDSAREQGNSIHYASCQATDPRAAWQGGQMTKLQEEVPFIGKTWFLWVVGNSMKQDGEGFRARAKLRIAYFGSGEVAALYIDRPYGQFQTLLENMSELQEWWSSWLESKKLPSNLPILMPPVWHREDGGGNNFQALYGGRYKTPLYIESANYGYQDTLVLGGEFGYDFFEVISKKTSIVTAAYKSRSKSGGVYKTPLKEVSYNPQSESFLSHEEIEINWRGFLSDEDKEVATYCYLHLGASNFRVVRDRYYVQLKEGQGEENLELELTFHQGEPCYLIKQNKEILYCLQDNKVNSNSFSLGFAKAVELPYTVPSDGTKGLVVTKHKPEDGFYISEEIKHIKILKEGESIDFYPLSSETKYWQSNYGYCNTVESKALYVVHNFLKHLGFAVSLPLPFEKMKLPFSTFKYLKVNFWFRSSEELKNSYIKAGWHPALDIPTEPIRGGGLKVIKDYPETGFMKAVRRR